MAKKSIPLVLGGGARRGIYLLGLLAYLEDRQVSLKHITGISVGGVVAALYTCGVPIGKIKRVFIDYLTYPGLTTTARALAPSMSLMSFMGLLDMEPVIEDLLKNCALSPNRNLRLVAYDLLSMQPVVFEGEDYDIVKTLAGCCALPVLMRPVEYQLKGRSMLLVDAGVYHPQPGSFSEEPSIIAKLIDNFFANSFYPDRQGDFVASIADETASFFGVVGEQEVEDLYALGYRRAKEQLGGAIDSGAIPVREFALVA